MSTATLSGGGIATGSVGGDGGVSTEVVSKEAHGLQRVKFCCCHAATRQRDS